MICSGSSVTYLPSYGNVVMLRKLIGDKAFYRKVIAVAVPILIQNGITHFVSLLDNIMVGQTGTVQMGGVSIVNQLLFIFNLAIFGISAGAGIFTAQFHGSKDQNSIRYTFRYRLMVSTLISLLTVGIMLLFGNGLISLFLTGEGDPADVAGILRHGRSYLLIMLIGLLPFALSNAYAGTLRECGQTVVPMVSGIAAMLTNLVLNWVLIFGHLGLPAMGVKGAAIATVISRFVELAIVAVWAHTHKTKYPFIRGLYKSFRIPGSLLKPLVVKGAPMLMNEILWSFAITVQSQCFSTCSLDVVGALNIVSTVNQLANVVIVALGTTIGILIGQMLGASRPKEEILTANRQLLTLSVVAGILFGGFLAAISGLFPKLYNTTDAVRHLAAQMILCLAAVKPFQAYAISGYYSLRSGGKTLITFLFDTGFLWLTAVPLAFFLSRFTDMPIIPLYPICLIPDILKAFFGGILLRKVNWTQKLTK